MIRVLVVDDSALVRRLFGEVLGREADFEIAHARTGEEALEVLRSFAPDVITLDVNMPGMSGLACLDRIMLERPTPVVMVSSVTAEGAAETIEALSLGAVDVIAKPSGPLSLQIDTLGPRLAETIRAASAARLPRARRLSERVRILTGKVGVTQAPRAAGAPKPLKSRRRRKEQGGGVVLVGASTGGPPALDALLSPIPPDFGWPIVVAQHMPRAFTGPLAQRLDRICSLSVREVTGPAPLEPGCVYVAQGDADIILSSRPQGIVAMSAPQSPDYRWHPSVDRLVESAMEAMPANMLVGVLMTGMGNDGAGSMTRLRGAGGRTIAEAEETAVVWGMPGELVRMGGAEFVAPLDRLADRLLSAVLQ